MAILGGSREELIETTKKKLIQVETDRSSEGKTKYTPVTRQTNRPGVIVNNKNDNNIKINQYKFYYARKASNISGH